MKELMSKELTSEKRARGSEEQKSVEPKKPKLEHAIEEKESDRLLVDLISQKHGPQMLALPVEEQQWLLKIHKNLGHPGIQKMTSFCKQMQCSPEIIRAIPDIKCSTCLETVGPKVPRPSAIHVDLDFGDIMSMDGVSWTNKAGKVMHFYHFVDHGINFQTVICAPSRTSENTINAIVSGWISWAGPPGMLCTDATTEFGSETFVNFLQKYGMKHRMIPPESSWQNSRAERHGGVLQEILTKMDHEEAIETYEQLHQALAFATSTKHQWSKHRGYPPEMLVFGKLRRVPGSMTSDPDLAAKSFAEAELPEGLKFREELACHERARKAFCQVDNSQALRRAEVQRSRPSRGQYKPGEWIMVWRKEGRWIGPMKVIIQEDRHVVWASLGNRLFKVAPEQIRPLSAVEEIQHREMCLQKNRMPDLQDTQRYEDLRSPNLEIPPELSQAPGTPPGDQELFRRRVTSEQPDTEPESPPSIKEQTPESFEYSPEFPSRETPPNETNASPEAIPVPEDDDDELLCEAFSLTLDEVWRLEIEMSLAEWHRCV